jgi:hypothetical protein
MPFSHDRHSENKGGHGGNFFEKGWDAAAEKNPKLREIQQKILPTNMSLEEEFQADLYKKPVQPYVYEKPNKVIVPTPEAKKNKPVTVQKKEVIVNIPNKKNIDSKEIISPVGLQKQDSTPTTVNSEPTLLFQGRDFIDRTGLTPGNYSLKQVNEMLKIKGYPEVKDNRSMSYLTKLK